jgi:sporulation protein YlmC with PRC-barrel domain
MACGLQEANTALRGEIKTQTAMKKTHLRFFIILFSLSPLTIQAQSERTSQDVSENEAKLQRVKADSWRASQMIGTNVKNAENEAIGEVKDLVVDFRAGEILAVVISSGGFLGIGDKLSTVPVAALRYDVDAKAFKTQLTKSQLQRAPNHENLNWPDYGDPANISGIRTYRDSIEGLENHRSMRDDARGSEEDVNMTRQIRTQINDSNLSISAKNIMIITHNGEVTLRGVVKDREEHQEILRIAGEQAGNAKIVDELKVEE